MARKLKKSVVVITGASSGIGRATAITFARKGASVVLAARRERLLRELVTECEQAGGRAIAVKTDVRDENAVQDLARRAAANFGRIDVWINNAGVSVFSRFEEAPSDVYRGVIETNLFGCIHGIRAVLPYFREQGGGVIINNSSVLSKVGGPYISAYATSKFGIRGLSESLFEELREDKIYVCNLLPASIDTPFFQHAANYTGNAAKPISPVYDAQQVADAIIDLAQHPKREMTVGTSGYALSGFRRVAPGGSETMFSAQVEKDHFQDKPQEPTSGNVLESADGSAEVSGGWKSKGGSRLRRLAGLGAIAIPAYVVYQKLRDGNGRSITNGKNPASGIAKQLEPAWKSSRRQSMGKPWQKIWR